MAVRTMPEVIAAHPFFEGLAQSYVDLIAGCARNAHYKPGEYLLTEGAPADTFYLVRGGRVAIEIVAPGGAELTVRSASDGDIVGWSWLFPPYRNHFDAVATQATRVTAFDGACLRGKVESDPALGYELLKRFTAVVIKQLQATRVQLLDLYGQSEAR